MISRDFFPPCAATEFAAAAASLGPDFGANPNGTLDALLRSQYDAAAGLTSRKVKK